MPPPAVTRAQSPRQVDWSLAWLIAVTLLAAIVGLAPTGSADETARVEPAGVPPATPTGAWTGNCTECHTVSHNLSHPVGIAPSMPIPPEFPLEDGRLTCTTCHTPDRAAHESASRDRSPLIRDSIAPANLCARCHQGSMASGPAAHASRPARAHLRWPDRGVMGRGAAITGHAALDDETLSCLECHDGSLARDAGGHAPRAGFDSTFDQDHPIGVPLRAPIGSSRHAAGPLADPDSLDPRIRLFSGMVGCGSCHSVYSPLEHDLVMSNYQSRLCLECHTY